MPFYPPDVPGLTWWLKPQHYPLLAQDDPITFWPDEGGQQKNATQVDPAVAPTYQLNAVNGFPAAKFNGVDQFMDGPGAEDIIDPAHYSVMMNAYFPDVTTEQTLFSAGSSVRMYVENDEFKTFNSGDTSTYPITIGWHTVALQKFGNTIRSMVDDPFAKVLIPTSPPATAAFLIGKDAGGNFFNGMIEEIIIQIFGQQQQSFAKTFAYMMRNAIDRSEPLERERDALSRRLVANERSRMFITQDVPLGFLDSDLLQPLAMSHPQIPHPSGQGAGLEKWNRRVLNLMERVETVGEYKLSLGLADRTGVSHLYRESGVAEFTAAPRREGVAVSGMGVRRLFSHQTELFLPAPSGIVDQVLPGNDLGHPQGTFQDPHAIQWLLRSSFIDGLDGITTTGASGSIDVIDDEEGAVKLFGNRREPTDNGLNLIPITTKHIRFTAGNPHTADLIAEWPLTVVEETEIATSSVAVMTTITTLIAHGLTSGDEVTISGHTGSTPDINGTHIVNVTGLTTFTIAVQVTVAGEDGTFTKLIQADDTLCFSIDIRSENGPLCWAIQNDVDSEYVDNTAQGWDPSLVWNELPWDPDAGLFRERSNPIIWPSSPGQATLFLGMPNGSPTVDASTADVYHVQLEDHAFPTSRWPQDNVFVGRRQPVGLCYFENPAAKMFNEPGFTIAMRITPPWGWEDLQKEETGGVFINLWQVQYENPPTTNYWRGGIDCIAPNQWWALAIKQGAGEEIAYQKTDPPERETEIPVIWRCTSATNGELGLAANSMTIFAAGVRGEDRIFTITRPTPIVNPRVEFNLYGATFRDLHFDYRVWSDEECVAWSLL